MKVEFEDVNRLLLDPSNSRFAELYSGRDTEDELVEYLLYTEAAEEVAKNIADKGYYYPDEVLWVVRRGDKFLVKDGNRRCAAVKALINPKKYGLNLPSIQLHKLPVMVYSDENELDRRIQEQHTHSLFREWDRIAKALKAHEMHNSGSSEDSLREIDSNPAQLIKLANFYYAAVKIAGEDLKRLLRRGRGKLGGKTIIFERLFSYSKQCGYKFKNSPSYKIDVFNSGVFTNYILALIAYLKSHSDVTHKDVDDEKASFLKRLKDYNFVPDRRETVINAELKTIDLGNGRTKKRGSIESRPNFERKQIAPKLKRLIDECYNLDDSNFANAKVSLARVVFEAVLKYVVEETRYKNKKISSCNYFRSAFFNKQGIRRKYTDFTILKGKFIELILDTGTKNSFKEFDLDRLHQIIHNYKVGAGPGDARTTAENLIPLINFMLKDIGDLLASLDTRQLI